MKVRCRFTYMGDEQWAELGIKPQPMTDLAKFLTVGKVYTAIGLEFDVDPDGYENGPKVVINPDVGYLVALPMYLFEITRPQVSHLWYAHCPDPASIYLGPTEIFADLNSFIERLDRSDVAAQDEFARILTLLEAEDAT